MYSFGIHTFVYRNELNLGFVGYIDDIRAAYYDNYNILIMDVGFGIHSFYYLKI